MSVLGSSILRIIMDSKNLIHRERARGECYRMLAACFYLPCRDEIIEEKLLENLTGGLQQICPEAAVFSSAMRQDILLFSDEDLAVEYARLFVGPYEMTAPPYGSIYLDGAKKIMSDSTMEVIRSYQAEGLARDSNFKNLPDHIAVELEFMYYLVFKETEALEKPDMDAARLYLEKQISFYEKFLGRWVTKFCSRINEGTENSFYLGLAGLTRSFIETERERIVGNISAAEQGTAGKINL
ncbi:MAG: molecular chaperone TorD [Nitrospiraceae bacterium]|nr:MAG: molecular chaperone TorD [Nitrospiraceae bacterium]